LRRMKRGFTLIEAMTVVAIIGTLATLSTYVVTSAQRQARDAKRRSDLTAIGVAFQARYEAQTCSNPSEKSRYPGHDDSLNNTDWQVVGSLGEWSDSCGAFTEFLSSIPTDPRYNDTHPYQFNLSREGTVIGKHFRLRAKLEKTLTQAQRAELDRLSQTWVSTSIGFGGKLYGQDYNYFIGD